MAVVGTGSLRDGFAIRDTRFFELNLQFLVILQTPFQCTQVEFTLSVHNGLAQLLGLVDNPCRVFLAHTVQDNHHLFRIGFIQRLDGAGIFGIRIFNEVETILSPFGIQRIARMHILQFHRAADITGYHFLHLDTVGSCTCVNLRNTLLRTAVGIGKVFSFVYLAAHNLEILHITDMRFNGSLEEIQGSRSVGIGFHNFTACIVHRRHFVYKRNNITQELHQTAHTHILARTYAEYGEHAAGGQSFADALAHLVFGQRILFEEFLHQGFIVFGSGLHQCFMHGGCFLHLLSGNIFDCGCSAFRSPRIFFHQKYINQRIEIRSGSQRVLNGNHF